MNTEEALHIALVLGLAEYAATPEEEIANVMGHLRPLITKHYEEAYGLGYDAGALDGYSDGFSRGTDVGLET